MNKIVTVYLYYFQYFLIAELCCDINFINNFVIIFELFIINFINVNLPA